MTRKSRPDLAITSYASNLGSRIYKYKEEPVFQHNYNAGLSLGNSLVI